MAEQDFHSDAIGEVYAQALVNEAQKRNALAEITEDVRGIGEVLRTNAPFSAFVRAATIDDQERVASLEKIFAERIHPLTLSLLKSMARRERLLYLPNVVRALETILKKLGGSVDVELTSAAPLSEQTLARVREAVARSLGKTPDFKIKVDASLIGGMMLRIEDTLIDGSVETQLEKIGQQMKAGGLSRLQKNPAAAMG